jgi:hypothetical protein
MESAEDCGTEYSTYIGTKNVMPQRLQNSGTGHAIQRSIIERYFNVHSACFVIAYP